MGSGPNVELPVPERVASLTERLRVAIEASQLGTWTWDPARDTSEWSPRTFTVLGVPPGAKATRELLLDRVHPEDRPRVSDAIAAALHADAGLQVDFRLGGLPAGEERWVRAAARRLDDALVGTVADVTPLKRAEREARLRDIISRNTTQALFLTDSRQQCTHLNAAAERLVGYTLAELAGRPLHDVIHHTRPDGRPYPLAECPIQRALGTRNGVAGEEMFIHRDGHFVPVAFTASPIVEDGRPLGTVLELRDLTRDRHGELERRELLLREQEARREAEAASRAKDEFLALLGHELRNPLAPIVTALQLMKLKGTRELEREREVIERQVRHMTQLVDDLLDISRITRGTVRLRLETVELRPVVGRAVEMASPLLEERGHRLSLAIPPIGLEVHGDALRLAQVFANLLTNAAKYTPAGGHIEVRGWHTGSRVRVSVKDNGRGIDGGMLERIFEPFVQGERRHESVSGGLGLGLPLVRSLVLLHEGSVRAVSEGAGLGSEFIVELPAGGGTARRDEGAAVPRGHLSGSEAARVLVVDDNEDAAVMVAEALRAIGYDCRVAHDGPSALAAAAAFRPAVAIVDIGLPVMDGYELGRRLTATVAPELALVALTGYGEERDRQRSRAAGFAAHLVKPVDLQQLANTLATLTS